MKEEFLNLLRSTQRDGVEDLIEFLEEGGFFKAPASSNHHLNTEGGLMEHSLNTCHIALTLWESLLKLEPTLKNEVSRESVIIASLLHDVCKMDIYKRTVMKKKNAIGVWEDAEGYKVSYKDFPMGHGEKSVILVMQYMALTNEEMLAIRWHMSAWDLTMTSIEQVKCMDTAKSLYPLVSIIQSADSLAAAILERSAEDANL